ncbi:hypothetical protein JH06_4522 [Blastocystis sp. subtype 4]|uniref:hypothetical protein n=1 Tax=Blastocystis sp. subtype 4 TaxID=944170 RepID=UPI0007118B52|nr:hypothetical protein JH06_4522 [Blastocystis sp. subtype 4]KNB41917.1 hypothetical protein JH06_4522 [Blastocystis sp. subtype 4]|eukprot:XP_014525360.1 hypothetical protein JH06_4522 [Blastocystis sp. subtype 4]
MYFCPNCGCLLLVETGVRKGKSCDCRLVSARLELKRKEVEDILGGAAQWENAAKTEARCPYCEHDTAYFQQIQIRSADEPMTTFYRCANCERIWSDNN